MKVLVLAALFTVALCYHKDKGYRCNKQEDCGKSACCVLSGDPFKGGRCYSLGREGKRCNPPEAALEYYNGKFLYYCPCQEGLKCQEVGSKKYFKSLRCTNPDGVTRTTPASSESSESDESSEERTTQSFDRTTDYETTFESGEEKHKEGPGGGTDFDEEDIFHERE